MNLIIPLAGFGTRLRPHTYTKPKPLINVAGKPVLGHILDRLMADGTQIDTVVFVVGFLGDQIHDYVSRNYPGLRARYVEQKELNGQAPAILLARDLVAGPTFVVFVDTLAHVDLSSLRDEQADGVIFVKEVEDPRRFGVVQLNADGHITRFVEKPANMDNRLAVIGMYYFRDAARLMRACEDLLARDIKTQGEYFLADALNLMIETGARLRTSRVDVWLDCGKPDTLLETNRYLLEHGHDNSGAWNDCDCVIVPPVHIHPSATIVRSVIGPYATIAEGCQIEDSIVRDSIVDAGARVTDHILARSLIGRDALLIGRPRRFNVGDSSVVGFDFE